jgi:hypothetical protein
MAGFCNSADGLRIPDFMDDRSKWWKVSGYSLNYSRFAENPVGDQARSHCLAELTVQTRLTSAGSATGKFGILSLHCASSPAAQFLGLSGNPPMLGSSPRYGRIVGSAKPDGAAVIAPSVADTPIGNPV